MNEILIILGLILLNGLFSMSEIALISARKSRLVAESKKGNKAAATALKLANEPDRFLSTVQIGITLIGILTGIYSGSSIAIHLTEQLEVWGVSTVYASGIARGIIVVIVTYLTLVFGELLPKRIGLRIAESAAQLMARPMYILSLIAAPFVWLLSQSTSLIYRLFRINESDGKVTEEEIKSMIDDGTEVGTIQPLEKEIVNRVFMLGDLRIKSIMTHRNDLIYLELSMNEQQVKNVLSQELYDVYPVIDAHQDQIRGLIQLKDLVVELGNPHFDLATMISSTSYIQEETTVYKALEQMRKQNISRALVCDEWGVCTGIITLKDILNGLIGEVSERLEEPLILARTTGEGWFVDGQCPMYDFLTYFERDDLYQSDSEYSTLAGLLLKQLQHIPISGEQIAWNGFNFEIADMDGARIDKILVTFHPHTSTHKKED